MARTGGESQASYVMEVKHVLPNVPRCKMSFGESKGLSKGLACVSGQVVNINNVFRIFLHFFPPFSSKGLGFEDIVGLALGDGV